MSQYTLIYKGDIAVIEHVVMSVDYEEERKHIVSIKETAPTSTKAQVFTTTDGSKFRDYDGNLSPHTLCLDNTTTIRELFEELVKEPQFFILAWNKYTLIKTYSLSDVDDPYLLLHGNPATAKHDSKKIQNKFDDIFKEIYGLNKKK
jgi:hypothetical protein